MVLWVIEWRTEAAISCGFHFFFLDKQNFINRTHREKNKIRSMQEDRDNRGIG